MNVYIYIYIYILSIHIYIYIYIYMRPMFKTAWPNDNPPSDHGHAACPCSTGPPTHVSLGALTNEIGTPDPN